MENHTIQRRRSDQFLEIHTKSFKQGLVMSVLLLTTSGLLFFKKLGNPYVSKLDLVLALTSLIGGITILGQLIVRNSMYLKRVDFKIKKEGIVLPNPPRKDIVFSKKADPYFVSYDSINRIKKDKEVTMRMRIKRDKTPRKVCIIEKENGDKIKLRPDYFTEGFDEFVDELIEIHNQKSLGDSH